MIKISVLFYMLTLHSFGSDAAKILGVSWAPSRSHHEFFRPIWTELSLRGHEVTTITSIPIRDESLTNLTEIDVSSIVEALKQIDVLRHYSKDNWIWNLVFFVNYVIDTLIERMLSHDDVQELIQGNAQFDVVLVEAHHPAVYAFGERFQAPVVGLATMGVPLEIYDIYGNPTHPLISPDILMPVDSSPNDHPFLVRCKTFLFNVWKRVLYYWFFLPGYDQIVRKHFGGNFPYLGEICQKRSTILLTNVNFVTNPIRANVPSVIEVDQIHIRRGQKLPKKMNYASRLSGTSIILVMNKNPLCAVWAGFISTMVKDLQDYLDASNNGVVYFSLGTNVRSSALDNRTLNEIIRGFAQLPFNVLWKWEKDELPALSSNVLTRKFFPQQDVLAHPNTKVFVTQGGLHSIEEAIHHEVPMVAIPVFGDQPLNARRLVEFEMAVELPFSDITSESLVECILGVTRNESYKMQLKKYKSLLEDQPLKGVDKVIWWIEHVIRHKGAEHLRSPAADMTFVRYFMLDVIALILLIIAFFFFVLYKFIYFVKCILNRKVKLD